MTQWFYSDTDRNRHGPVTAADLAELHRAGQLQPDTLVWREGLAQWASWSSLMGEVIGPGPAIPSPAPPPFAQAPTAVAGAAPAAPAAVGADGFGTFAPGGVAAPSAAAPMAASPYAPPRTALNDHTDFVAGGEVVYAGFWRRAAASTLDSLALVIPVAIIQVALAAVLGATAALSDPTTMFASGSGAAIFAALYLFPLLLQAAYFAVMHASPKQASLGKMAVGIKVVDENGGRISFARGFGRYFAFLLGYMMLGIGVLMAAFTDRKRGLHDMMCSTLVVDRWAHTGRAAEQSRGLDTVTKVVLWVMGIIIVLGLLLMLVAIGIATARFAG